MAFEKLNAYRVMWLIVFFDLPTTEKSERKAAAHFRKAIMADGFTMMQYSVYKRFCASSESADTHTRRVKSLMPGKGHISILRITDKQYGLIQNFWGRSTKPLTPPPQQLEFF